MDQSKQYFNLKGMIFLHPKYGHYSTYTTSQLHKNIQKLFLNLFIKPLQTLTLHINKLIMSIKFQQIQIQVSASVSPKLVEDKTRFENIVKVEMIKNKNRQLICQRVIEQDEEVQLSVGIQANFIENQKGTIIIGDMNAQKILKCKLNLTILDIQPQKINFEIRNSQIQVDGPIDSLPIQFQLNIDDLPTYESPLKGEGSLYLCHDMMGGYIQDTNIMRPNAYSYHTYRCLNLWNTQIFNYFSHHLITVPPQHWRRICSHHQVKCLGTFIIESKTPSDQVYLTKQTAHYLVYLCRKFRFDGYLINIQYGVSSTHSLKQWLEYLTSLVHEKVPNSKIIWYDSVITSGNVQYQNQLNQLNYPFYERTDGIFLNYWWSQTKLNNSSKTIIKGKPVYVGNDCFGRGTYGGGQYNIYKAIKTINQYTKLNSALFAMGYTYENNAQRNRQLWKEHEKAMYRGASFEEELLPHAKWAYLDEKVNGRKWQIADDWAVTSFDHCRRTYTKPLNHYANENGLLKITYYTTVQGTPPKTNDHYSISMKIITNGMTLNEENSGPLRTSENEEQISHTIYIDTLLVENGTFLLIMCEGRDQEHWAGNYGARFKGDKLLLALHGQERDWISKVSMNPISTLPYHTYMNLGHGKHFHFEGKPIKQSYDYLSDQDFPHTHSLNPPDSWAIEYETAYMGGTSLKITSNQLYLCLLKANSTNEISIKIITKNTSIKRLFFQGEEKIQGKLQLQVDGEWKTNVYRFQAKKLVGKVILHLTEVNGLLGGFSVYQEKQQKPTITIDKLKLSLSEQNPPISPYVVDLQASMHCGSSNRVLIGCGQQFMGFGWFDEFNNHRIVYKNIQIKGKQPNLTIYSFDENGFHHQVLRKQINMKSLVEKKQYDLS